MKAFCINLEERPEKWRAAEQELTDFDVVRWPAIKENPGYDGCRKSHLALLKYIRRFKEPVLICEDDIIFDVPNPMSHIQECMDQLPLKWDILYLGATLNVPLERYSESLFRIKKGWATHAMIFNPRSNVDEYIIAHNGGGRKIDVFYADVVQEHFNCYLASPMIANQRNGYSDVVGVDQPTGDFIKERYNRYTND